MRARDLLEAASLTQDLRDVLMVVGLLLLVWGAAGASLAYALWAERWACERYIANVEARRASWQIAARPGGEPVNRPTPPTGGSSVVVPNVISEAVARQKWCPWARVSSPADEPAFNRLGVGISQGCEVPASHVPDMARCIGSRCMAWRQRSRAGYGYCGAAGPL
ncbi:hypothetical protein [Methylobacterium platani]|uniref:Uncharacterized protein n=2 Tax=Methylobacterium platani TaxID=427683 RepID=A0A179SIC3_9HYPH|nr:hypothetical protein [Methylobacterium platani]KMO21398.1 hypothetical protein SQ03_03340 [Methylobacterium platani JCM 14648]OAS26323.1 hypothetical protein A5481_06305 [Methylobacterium platani]